jgi:hypothetical protein
MLAIWPTSSLLAWKVSWSMGMATDKFLRQR